MSRKSILLPFLTVIMVFMFAVSDCVFAGMVAYWPMNEGTNGTDVTTIDDVIDDASHPATDGTSSTSGDTWYDDPDRGIVYKRTDADKLEAGYQGITNDFTWSIWVKTIDNTSAQIMGDRSGGSGDWNKLTLGGLGTWASISKSGGWGINDGSWHHIALRREGSIVSVWTNGVMYPSTDSTTNDMNHKLFFGGDRADWGETLDGCLSDISIWDSALSAGQIDALANLFGVDGLLYTADMVSALFDAHVAQSSVVYGKRTWTYASGLGSTEGLSLDGDEYTLVLDGSSGTGLIGSLPPAGTILIIK